MAKNRKGRRSNPGQLGKVPNAEDLIRRQMAEAGVAAAAASIIQEVNKIISSVQQQVQQMMIRVVQTEGQVNFLMQTVDLIKTGLADKGILTDKDLDGILAKVLKQQEKAREILGNETNDDKEKIKQLIEEAGLEQGPAENILKTYNDAVKARKVASEEGTTFEPILESENGEDGNSGPEKEGQDGPGDQGSSEPDQSRRGDPGGPGGPT
ncbi:hypothetical protein LCGC14_0430610 [marine sediment metagenome]|uniref:Uncharacterized protein n=1 Tax=marine sediment metagenome TaxID=412755 RepID=A0A0F9VXP3_9ZZZZ